MMTAFISKLGSLKLAVHEQQSLHQKKKKTFFE